jgi:hypothetical protein
MTANLTPAEIAAETAKLAYCDRCADRHHPAGDCDAEYADRAGLTLVEYRVGMLRAQGITVTETPLPPVVEITREGRREIEQTDRVTDLVPVLAGVEVEIYAPDHGTLTGWSADPVWAGVDRPTTGGMVCRDRKTANRLAAAIRAGKAYVPVAVKVDSYGHTYVETRANVLGRTLNADLRRLGF